MDLRPSDFRLNFWQAAALGAMLAMIGGTAVGGYFKTGYSLAAPASGDSRLVVGEAAPEPITYMTDASGRVPDYVIGTDYTNPPAPEPVYAAYEPEPLPDWTPGDPAIAPAAYAEPAPPPSIGGDILAGLRPVTTATPQPAVAQNESGADRVTQPTPIVLEDGADPAAFRARSPEPVTVAAAY